MQTGCFRGFDGSGKLQEITVETPCGARGKAPEPVKNRIFKDCENFDMSLHDAIGSPGQGKHDLRRRPLPEGLSIEGAGQVGTATIRLGRVEAEVPRGGRRYVGGQQGKAKGKSAKGEGKDDQGSS